MEEITIKKAQKMVDDWIQTVGVRYFNECCCFLLAKPITLAIKKYFKSDKIKKNYL